MHVAGLGRDLHDGHARMSAGEPLLQPSLARRQRHPLGVQAQDRGGQLVPAAGLELLSGRHRPLGRQRGAGGAVHAVDDQSGQRHRLLLEPLDEVAGLPQGVALRCGDDDESGAGGLEQVVGGLRPLPEPAEHRLERADELRHVLEHLRTDDLGDDAGEEVEPGADDPEVGLAAGLRGGEQDADHAPVEERREPLRGVEEVQGRARRRGVHDDQVVVAAGLELAELLHRHVLLRAGEGAGQRLVEGVLQDLGRLVALGVGQDDLVEGPLHVEHHRVERAAAGRVDALDAAGGVVQLGQAHRLRQPLGRVDREHDGTAPALGGSQRERGGGGRLADAAGAGAHQDPGGVEQVVDVEGGAAVLGHAIPCSWRSPASSYSPPRSMLSGSSGSS